jgi:hypothetical protein
MTGPASERVNTAPSGNEPPRLASRRFKNYAGDPSPTHEPGSLFSRSKKGRSRRGEIKDRPQYPDNLGTSLYAGVGVESIRRTAYLRQRGQSEGPGPVRTSPGSASVLAVKEPEPPRDLSYAPTSA